MRHEATECQPRPSDASVQAEASGGARASRRGACAIGVMAKTPRPGYSKTRLCPPLQPEQAALLSAAFLRDTTENIIDASVTAPITGYVAYAPLGAEALLRPHLAPGTPCIPADGDIPPVPGVEGFGTCLLHATQEMFARGHAAACVLSSDTPTLPTAILIRAARLLLDGDDRRVVLGACDDGGYYLLGMRAFMPGCSPTSRGAPKPSPLRPGSERPRSGSNFSNCRPGMTLMMRLR